jgi:pyruvate/2-oxoacid:ferredoxin oxidoreductase beta subunit
MAMAALLELLTDQPVIICNGFPSREAYKIADRPTHFYMIGSMGSAPAIGLGVALAKPKKQVVIFDGDGNVLMGHSGYSRRLPKNFSCGVRQRSLREYRQSADDFQCGSS